MYLPGLLISAVVSVLGAGAGANAQFYRDYDTTDLYQRSEYHELLSRGMEDLYDELDELRARSILVDYYDGLESRNAGEILSKRQDVGYQCDKGHTWTPEQSSSRCPRCGSTRVTSVNIRKKPKKDEDCKKGEKKNKDGKCVIL